MNKKLIIRIFAPAALIAYVLLNYFTLSKIESHLRSAINKSPELSLDFVTKNLLSNTLEAQIRWQDNPESTPALVYLSPSYFRQAANYQLTINDIAPLLNNLTHQTTSSYGTIPPTALSMSGSYSLLTHDSVHYINKLNIQDSDGLILAADKATISLHHDDQHNPEILTSFEVSGLKLSWISLDYFKYDTRGTTLDSFNIKSVADGIRILDDGLETIGLIANLPPETQTDLQQLKISPVSYDLSLTADQKMTQFLLGESQNIDSDLHAKGHFLLSSPLLINETFLTGSILPQETDFRANLQFKSEYRISDTKNFDRFRTVSKAISKAIGANIELFIDDASPAKINLDSDLTAHILPNGAPLSLQGYYKEDRFYPNNSLRYTYATFYPEDLRQLSKGIYVSVNGKFIGPQPESTVLLTQIKTNNPLYVRILMPILAASPSELTQKEHIIEVHIPSGN